MQDQKNLLLMIAFSVAIILGFQVFFAQDKPRTPPKAPPASTQPAPTQPGVPPGATTPANPAAPATPGQPARPGVSSALDRQAALARSPRVKIDTPRVSGSIALRGGLLDDVTLNEYWQTIKKRERVHLLKPKGSQGAYYVNVGWWMDKSKPGDLPSEATLWQADRDTLTVDNPVTLTWDNGKGLVFKRTYRIDRNYMISVTQSVTNSGRATRSLNPFGIITLNGEPETLGFFILHEGPITVVRKSAEDRGFQEEISYSSVKDRAEEANQKPYTFTSFGGWTGFTDHYWLVSLIPPNAAKTKMMFQYVKQTRSGQRDVFLNSYVYENGQTVAPGQTVSVTNRVFAGAKESKLLKAYQEDLDISRFEWAIDWGWFWFFTKPFLWLLALFNSWVGNFGVAILILTIGVKIIFLPLANRSYKSMSRMKKLQPEMMKLRERYKDDKQRQNQEMMALYKREKVNPAAGCWPIMIQIPVFFALYKVLFVAIEMRHAPFFGWIQDLSAKDPTSIINLFGLLPWDAPTSGLLAIVSIGVWPIIMGVTMWLQQKLNPAPPDPVQQKIFMLLPIVFTFMLATFPAGLVIYWAWNNILSIGQQWIIMKNQGVYQKAPNSPTNIADLTPKAEATDGAPEPAEADAGSAKSGAKDGGSASNKRASGKNRSQSNRNTSSRNKSSSGSRRGRGGGKRRR